MDLSSNSSKKYGQKWNRANMEEMEMIDAQTVIYIQKEQHTYYITAVLQQIYWTS